MNQDLAEFSKQWIRVALAAMVPVVLTSFLTIPFNLGAHPGEPAPQVASVERHIT